MACLWSGHGWWAGLRGGCLSTAGCCCRGAQLLGRGLGLGLLLLWQVLLLLRRLRGGVQALVEGWELPAVSCCAVGCAAHPQRRPRAISPDQPCLPLLPLLPGDTPC